MLRKAVVVLCVCAIPLGAQADEVELALTEDVLEGRYFMDADPLGLPGGNINFGLLFSDDRDIVASAGLIVPVLAQGPFFLSVGGRAHGALLADPSDDVFALAPGLEGRFVLPGQIPGSVFTSFYYAPEILTFGNADDVIDFNIRYELPFTERFTGFVGFRLLNFDRDDGEDDIVEHVQIGVRFGF